MMPGVRDVEQARTAATPTTFSLEQMGAILKFALSAIRLECDAHNEQCLPVPMTPLPTGGKNGSDC